MNNAGSPNEQICRARRIHRESDLVGQQQGDEGRSFRSAYADMLALAKGKDLYAQDLYGGA